jgi:hypothetical protein
MCENIFPQRCTQNRHLRVHSRERPFSCKVCKRRFTSRFILNAHLKSHCAGQAFRAIWRRFIHIGSPNRPHTLPWEMTFSLYAREHPFSGTVRVYRYILKFAFLWIYMNINWSVVLKIFYFASTNYLVTEPEGSSVWYVLGPVLLPLYPHNFFHLVLVIYMLPSVSSCSKLY